MYRFQFNLFAILPKLLIRIDVATIVIDWPRDVLDFAVLRPD
jgi:hypothetical protein